MSGPKPSSAKGWRVEIRVQGGTQDPLERLLGVLRVRQLPFQHLSYDPPRSDRSGVLVIEGDTPLDGVQRVLAFVQRTVGVISTAVAPLPERAGPVTADRTMALT